MLYDRKMILIKIVLKKGNKKPKINNERRAEKSEKKKNSGKNESEVKNISKTFAKVSIFTKYCILVCQNFQPSKISGYTPLMK